MDTEKQKKPIILFDGSCGLCSGIVQFILTHKQGNGFIFIPLKSPQGRFIIGIYKVSSLEDDTVMIIDEGVVYAKSDAVMFVLKQLKGWWRVLSWARVVPRWIRDAIYDVVARNRKAWFGTSTSCLLPPLEENRYRVDTVQSKHIRNTQNLTPE